MFRFVSIFFIFVFSIDCFATTYTVTNNNTSGTGSLQSALASAGSGDTIQFNNGIGNITLTTNNTINGITFTAPSNQIIYTNPASGASFVVAAACNFQNVSLLTSSASNIGLTLNDNITINAAATVLTYSGIINNGTGNHGITKTGAQTLFLTNSSNSFIDLNINSGSVSVPNAGSLGATSGSASVNFTGNSSLLITGTVNTTKKMSVSSGVTGTINVASGYAFTPGAFSGAGNVVINGLGTVNFSNQTNFTGSLTQSAGTINLGATLATTTINLSGGIFNVNSSGGFRNNATVTMTGTGVLNSTVATTIPVLNMADAAAYNVNESSTVGILNSSSTTPIVSIATGKTLTVNGTSTYAGVLSGSGSLARVNNGIFTLSNNTNSYSGGTTITTGAIQITAPSLGTGTVTMNGGILEASTTCTLSNPFTFTANSLINIDPGQTLTLTGQFLTNSHTFDFNNSSATNLGTLMMNNSSSTSPNSIGIMNFYSGTYALSSTHDVPTGNINVINKATDTNVKNLKFLESFTANFNSLILNDPLTIEVVDGVTCTATGSITTGGFTKIGNGTLNLNTTNPFTGSLAQSAGTINLGSALTTTTVNLNGGTFNVETGGSFAAATTLTMTGTSTLNVDTNSTLGVLTSSATTPTVSISNGKTLTINGASSSYAGVVSGAGALAYSGSGTFTLNNSSNNYSGGTTIAAGNISISNSSLGTGPIIFNGGILNVTGSTPFSIPNNFNLTSSAGTISVASGQIMTLGGAISGSNNLTLNGAGTLALTQSSPSYSGQTIINAGVLAISNASLGTNAVSMGGGTLETTATCTLNNPFTFSANGFIKVDNGQTLTLTGAFNTASKYLFLTGPGTLLMNNLTGNNSISLIQFVDGTYALSKASDVPGGNIEAGGGKTLKFLQSFTANFNALVLYNPLNIEVVDGVTCTATGNISLGNSGIGFTKTGAGTLNLNTSNTFTGSLTQSAGTINLGSALTTTTVNLNGGIFNVNSSGSFAAATTLAMTGSSVLNVNTNSTLGVLGTNDITPIVAIASGQILTVNGASSSYAGVVTGAGSLVYSGSGIFNLSNSASSYSGGTTITTGTIQITSPSLGTGLVTMNGGILDTAATSTLNNLFSLSANSTINIENEQTLTLTGQFLANSHNLILTGAGTLQMSNSAGNNNVYAIQLNGAKYAVTNTNDLPASPNQLSFGSLSDTLSILENVSGTCNLAFYSSGIVSVASGKTFTLSGQISQNSSWIKTGAGTFIASGTNSGTGSVMVQQGILNFTTNPITANITLAGGVLGFSPGTNFTWANQITGNGTFYKAGSADVTFTTAQNYIGPLYINSGSLIVNGASFPNVTNTQIAAGGTLQLNTDFTVNQPSGAGTIAIGSKGLVVDCSSASSFTGAITGSGTIDKIGVGSIELTQNNDVTSVTNHTGTFIANNKMTAANVHNIGTWKGNSTVSNFTNDGVLAPGNSIGTQVITGNFTTNSGSTVEIEYNDLGNSDLIQVTGIADILPGAQLKLIALPGIQFVEGQEYTFLTASSFSQQAFTNIVVENEADPFLHPIEMVYTPTSIGFVLGIAPYTQTDGYLVSLPSALANQIALGQVDAISNQLYMDVLSDIANNKENPCGFKTKEKRKIFSVVNVRSGNIKENQWNIANEFSITSGLVGVHLNNENNLSGGFGGGYTFGKTHGTNQNVKLYSNTIKLFGYFQTPCMKYFIVDGILAQDFSYYLGSRINIANDKARSSFFGMQTLAQIRAMIEAKIRSYVFMPLIAARYQYFYSGSYKESGAFQDNKEVGSDHQNLLYAEAGFNLCRPFYLKYGQIVPQVGFSYLLQTLDDQRNVEIKNYKGSWAQNHPIYAVEKNIYKFNGGIEFVRKDSTIYLNADYIVADLYEYTYDVRAGVQFKF